MTREKGFSKATLRVIEALDGDIETGKCFCPIHDDGSKPSLHVSNGDRQPVVLHCFGGGELHNDKIIEWLKAKGAWPSSTHLQPEHTASTQQKSKKKKRNYAVKIWNDLIKSNGQGFAPVLKQYLQPRGIKRVPTTAMMVMPVGYSPESTVEAIDFGMVLPIRNSAGKQTGIQATWLKPDLTAKRDKREDDDQRKSHGNVKGNFVELVEIDYSTVLEALLIGEGVETVLAGMQLTGLPGVATAGAWNVIKPPASRRYIILADNGDAGQKFARDQVVRIRTLYPDAVIQIATPVRPEKGKKGYDWNDALLESRDPTVLKKEILKSPEFNADDNEPAEDTGEAVNRKQVDSLVELAADAELFHTSDLVGYADMTIDGHRETWPIRSKGFRSWLLYEYYLATGSAPSGEALRLAIETLDAKARYDGPTLNIYLRVGGEGGKIYLDLCDKEWRAVEIDRKGWRVVSRPPVRFRRAPGMLSLPTPVKGGDIDELRPFVNVKGSDFVLLVSFIIAALRDRGPYPGLGLKGEEGSAKSTLAKLTRDLIDPHKVRARSLPRENRDLHVAANASHIIAFDNVSQIPDWLSDALCSLATGGGFATRALYTDMDEVLFEAVRPVILNGIEYATRSDLADRLIFLNLPPIMDTARFTEREFWATFEAARPRILGVLCDALAYGLRMLPYTPTENLPRMADFAQWSVAWEGALFEPGSFMKAYARNRKGATLDVIENDDVAVAVRKLMTKQDEWTGTATELLHVLGKQVGEKIEKSKDWPASAKSLGSKLKRAAKPLRKIGLVVEKKRDGDQRGTRVIVIYRQHDKAPQKTSETSGLSEASKIKPFKNRGSDNADKSDKFPGASGARKKRRTTEKG
jgi:hypothetical protein